MSFFNRPIHLAPLLALALALASQAASAQVEEYVLDPVHTRVQFTVSHAGFSSAIGTVSGSTGGLWFDPDDWSSARIEVSVPLQRVDLGDAKWNQATLARNLLDASQYPHATFISTSAEPVAAERARVTGLLTLRGQTREVVLDVSLNALKRHPLPPFRRTVGFSATTQLSRADFGITAWGSMIGDEVQLRMEVEAVRGRFDPGADGLEQEASRSSQDVPADADAPPGQGAEPLPTADPDPSDVDAAVSPETTP